MFSILPPFQRQPRNCVARISLERSKQISEVNPARHLEIGARHRTLGENQAMQENGGPKGVSWGSGWDLFCGLVLVIVVCLVLGLFWSWCLVPDLRLLVF